MKLKAKDIIETYESLLKIADKEVDFNTTCIIAKNLKILGIFKEIIDKKRNDIIIKYVEKNENGNTIQDENGNIKIRDEYNFTKDMEELLKSETDVDIKLIPKNSLKELKISAKDMVGLIDILEG